MILSDKTLTRMLSDGELYASPLEQAQIQPASIDIRLGDTFSVVEDDSTGIITLDSEIRYKTIKTDTYLLLPGQFVLATTMEYFRLPDDLTAFVEGRSSLGRMGLFIQNAGWVDPGFEGEITLELFNANRCAIELKAGRRVGQLVFAKLDDHALNPYSGKYQGQKGATGSRVYMDKDATSI
ncbi:MAG: dCTP deaminase [Ruminococcaceae bacterium]|nr:dCTP deaminase [Oscillospiraceae bacterium]